MKIFTRNRTMLLAAILGVKLAAVGGYAYAEGWFGGWFGAKPKPVAAAPVAAPSLGALPTREEALKLQADDRVMGRFGAPLTIIEYASLTCSHCADFNRETMPTVKKEWVDTGKAVYVLRDLPWDNLALGMSAIARCLPPEQFYPMSDAFFGAQKSVITSGNPLSVINSVAAQAGLNEQGVQACIRDEARQRSILRSKETARQVLGVKGTPALFVNGQLVEGAVKYDVLKKTLEAEYARATAAKAK